MKEGMQKISISSGSRPQKNSTECESYEGVQTFMEITENNLKEVQFERGDLLELILSPNNLNRAYLQVKHNHGSGGVDGLSVDKLADCLYATAEEYLFGMKIRKDMADGDPDKESSFYILKHTKCPAVLTENLFQDNKEDVDFLLSEEGKRTIVSLHVKGICKYLKV